MTDALRERLADGPVDYSRYIDAVLYTPEIGYYKRQGERVGRSQNTDFYTAESLGPVFAQCVIAATRSLLGEQADLAAYDFVEIAAEPERGLLIDEEHPFKTYRALRQGDALTVSGQAIVFANEWLDALPFHRLCYHHGSWKECGVAINSDGVLSECFLPELSAEVAAIQDRLPASADEGFRIDLPLAAESALAALLSQSWTGVLVLFDYGKRWETLIHEYPQGTARTYQQHTQGNDLLADPGQRDITCDVIWDPLEAICRARGFESVCVQRQESFFMHHAQQALATIMQQQAGKFSPLKQTLMELLHPGNLGHRFQVLSGIRRNPPS